MTSHPQSSPTNGAVAWQYRYRPSGSDEWSDWADCGYGGRAPVMRSGAYEIEERPLYLAPPDAAASPSPSVVERLQRDCAEAYQVIGVLASAHGDLFEDPQVQKALDNLSAAQEPMDPRPHDDLLPFTLAAPSPSAVKAILIEYLSHRGENPHRILRGGSTLWESHAPAMRQALALLNAPQWREIDQETLDHSVRAYGSIWDNWPEQIDSQNAAEVRRMAVHAALNSALAGPAPPAPAVPSEKRGGQS